MAENSPEKDDNEEIITAEIVEDLRGEVLDLREALGDAMLSLQIEDATWNRIGEVMSDQENGLDLDELKELSQTLRKHVAVTGLLKRGVELHTGYNFAKGMHIEGAERRTGSGRQNSLYSFVHNPINQESLFSATARARLQKGRYCEGLLLPLCDLKTQTVRMIPLEQIINIKVNPEFPDEAWAYLRSYEDRSGPEPKTKREWILTHRFVGEKPQSFETAGDVIEVRVGAVIADYKFNGQEGWVLGIPDAAAALPHYQAYMKFMGNGRVVTEALTKILYKVTGTTKGGVQSTSTRVRDFSGKGGVAAVAGNGELSAVATAGKGYDFASGDRLASQVALALNVPLTELLSDASAGGNFASSAALTPSTLNAMRIMQAEWVDFYRVIFNQFGIETKEISFPDIQDIDEYRLAQRLALGWGTGLIHPDEMREEFLSTLKIPSKHPKAPAGVIVPNNEAQAKAEIEVNAGVQAASPDQGRSNGAGRADSNLKTDQRSDTVSEVLKSIQIEQMREIVERFEAAVMASKAE